MNVARVPLRVSNKKAYVWDVDAIIRSKYHICGTLTGTLPHLSQQNLFLGVPLVLMPEEVVLLVEKQIAILVDDPQAHTEPSIPELQRWNSERRETVKHQIALSEVKSVKEGTTSGRAMTPAAIQKRKEREQKRIVDAAKAVEAAATSFDSPSDSPSEMLSSLSPRSETLIPSNPTQPAAASYTVTIPACSPFEWYHFERCSYSTIVSAKAAGIWEYPSNLQERARCGVFRDLWEQGYFMGGGIKFGGDYLVYPGDPLRYHSHFAASVLDSPTSALRPMEMVAHGRLGTATKKTHLLCRWDDEKQEVSYLSIEWAGFG